MEQEFDDNVYETDRIIDEDMLEMGDFVSEMSDIEGYLISEEEEMVMRAESVSLDFPMQLDIRVLESGEIKIGSSPPLYYVDTTIMPVFHQMKLNITVDTQ
ncbi:hypothetical protein C900_01242 [Fulvivirga imtechensis AK7]|uniref:Uncharacterized protein n=1 Tax=Fulvivirga imtechensis AK7 TaxID=1237149 RepID=L8JWJ1_9BACT|nr:hypothetical protein [Fulvivirga imtechensis]ELR72568.1 hypothetical protein C900_01242 [Fulvivirga imtechensis AK7]